MLFTLLGFPLLSKSVLKKHPRSKVKGFIRDFAPLETKTHDELGRRENTFTCKAFCANDYYSF